MPSKRSLSISIALLFCLSISYFFICTPWGVHIFGEVLFGNKEVKQYPPQEYPTETNGTKSIARTIELPETIKQPSGIDFDEKSNRFYIVTDQAEIIALSHDLKQINSSAILSNRPLIFSQGSVESIDCYQNKMYVGGDLGLIEIWEQTAQGWQKTGAIQAQNQQETNMESEALAINPDNGNLYIGRDNTITIIDSKGNLLQEITLQTATKSDRSVSEYLIAGMDFYQGVLYVVTEYHSAILTVDPSTGAIHSIYAIEGITEGAGLAVTEEAFFVVVDHEFNEASPGVKVYQR